MRRYGIALTLTALAAFVAAGHGHVAAATGARLTAITATDGAAPAVLIEASEQTPAVSRGIAQAPGGQQQYTGHPISLDFQGADLRAVLRTFAEISGLNVVIDPAVQGSVDVALRDVPWDQALDIILRANKLGTRWTARSSASRR